MSNKWSDLLEDVIVGKVVMRLLEEGFRLEISDQDGGGLFVYAAAMGGTKPKGGYEYWVRLVPGNGPDMIVDYTTNLETILKPAHEFSAQYRD